MNISLFFLLATAACLTLSGCLCFPWQYRPNNQFALWLSVMGLLFLALYVASTRQ